MITLQVNGHTSQELALWSSGENELGGIPTMGHKKQHFVPRSYLGAWCDPKTPVDQEPYVWVFPKQSGPPRNRAPKNLFRETEMYTIKLASGHRDLRLEHGLAELESFFADIARDLLPNHIDISIENKMKLSAFTAAMQARTPKQRGHFQGLWQGVLENMEALEAEMQARTPQERKAIASATLKPSRSEPSIGIDEVRHLAATPIQRTLVPIIETQVPILATMNLAFFEVADPHAFITSDAPCVWFDPDAHKRPFPYNSPGLSWPTIEVTLPVSPRQLLMFNRGGLDGYYTVTAGLAHEFNRRTRGYAHEQFIARGKEAHPYWYQLGPVPPYDAKDAA